MDQIANWVRFADTKATILFAGVGVVLTMVMTNGDTVVAAAHRGNIELIAILLLAASTALTFAWTLWWLYQSLRVRSTTTQVLNRFAWPTMTNIDPATLLKHATTVEVRFDAWDQVANLSAIASEKFRAQNHAVKGFVALIIAAALLVGLSVAVAGTNKDAGPRQPERRDAPSSRN